MVNGHSVYSILACLEKGGRSRRRVSVENKIRRMTEERERVVFYAQGGEGWPVGPERW